MLSKRCLTTNDLLVSKHDSIYFCGEVRTVVYILRLHGRFNIVNFAIGPQERKEGISSYMMKITNNPVVWKCLLPKCTYSSPRRDRMNDHIMHHLGMKRYACSECNYRSVDKSNLNRHYRKHRATRSSLRGPKLGTWGL